MQVTPFLMFQGAADAALSFYAELFPDAAIDVVRIGPDGAGTEGQVTRTTLTIAGQRLYVFDSPPVHDFGFTPAFSLFVDCDSEEDFERLAGRFAEGGSVLMPPGAYGFSRRFAWISDRFGVSWQLNLP